MSNMWSGKKKNLSYIPDLRKLDMCVRIHVGEKFALPVPDNHSPDAEYGAESTIRS